MLCLRMFRIDKLKYRFMSLKYTLVFSCLLLMATFLLVCYSAYESLIYTIQHSPRTAYRSDDLLNTVDDAGPPPTTFQTFHYGEVTPTQIKLWYDWSELTSLVGTNELPVTIYADYLIENRSLCMTDARLSLVVMVTSAPNHTANRQLVRQTWTTRGLCYNHGAVRLMFLLGRTNDSSVQRVIENEASEFGDILQGDFMDTYTNLTNKGVMAYKWLTERCQNAGHVMKIDDDVGVHVHNIMNIIIPYLANKQKTVLCHIHEKSKVIRNSTSKWYVPSNLFPGQEFYPEYCMGYFIVLSYDLIPILYEAAKTTPFFFIEDVYLHGLLLNRVPGAVRMTPPVKRGCKLRGHRPCLLFQWDITNSSIIAIANLPTDALKEYSGHLLEGFNGTLKPNVDKNRRLIVATKDNGISKKRKLPKWDI